MDYLKKLQEIYKAAATDFKLSGVLTDQQTTAWFTNVVSKSAFLGSIHTAIRNELSGNTGFIQGSDTAFTRTAEGTEITEGTHHSQKFSQFLLLVLDMAAFVGYSVLDDNPSADLLNKINQVLDTSAANSLQNLAINGTTDTYSSPTFTTLAKGWIQLGKDSSAINKVLLAVDDFRFDDLDALVQEMMLALPQEYRQNAVVLMSDNERRVRNQKIAETTSGDARSIALAAMGPEMKNTIGGEAVITPHFWPDDVFMITNPMNLEISIHKDVRRAIEEKIRRKGFEYTYTTKADFEIIHHDRAVIAYKP